MNGASSSHRPQVAAVIVAAGASERMGGQDKIFTQLCGRPLLSWSLDVFQSCPGIDRIVLVVSEKRLELAQELVAGGDWPKVKAVCTGGKRRRDSVAQGLSRAAGCQWVAIHDGARPLVSSQIIEAGLEAARECGAAVAAVPVKDTIKAVGRDSLIKGTPPRQSLWLAQTPQIFRMDIIEEAHRRVEGEATDDASLVEQLGYPVKVYMGSYENLKVTTPEDIVLAEAYLISRKPIGEKR